MKKIFILSIIILSGAMCISCEKFLDVQPTGTLTEDVAFRDIQGFHDAMYGAYAAMAKPHLYGENLSYGFVDKLGQLFIFDNSEENDRYIVNFEYEHKAVRPISDTIWAGQYTVISYLNNVLEHLKTTPIKHAELKLIEGEAHALRAFLHYDMVRLFADDYRRKPDARGIPYAYTFDLNNKKLFSLAETYKNILSDLSIAEKLLDNDNSISANSPSASSIYGKERYVHCNKFAVKAIKARVYHSMGNADSAAFYARQVIDSKTNFALEDFSLFNKVKRFPAPKELIFGLYTTRLTDNIFNLFLAKSGAGNFTQARTDLGKLYETGTFTAQNTDVRYSAFYKEDGWQTFRFIRFLSNEAEIKDNPVTGIGLIRLPEMYYILSESVYDKNKTDAIALLNEVRKSRGLQPVSDEKVNTKEAFETEMMRERMREMPGEGQVFFALKYYNKSFTKAKGQAEITPSSEIFVLPWPQKELDFGNK
ncbi:MAG: RagB/SusD family nutrient uptake outer membrane protein [Bacteroidia bacterium]|nr:RagB/SusD family nutrient uptake outer membrane protein [Bacteroidia bacterium]